MDRDTRRDIYMRLKDEFVGEETRHLNSRERDEIDAFLLTYPLNSSKEEWSEASNERELLKSAYDQLGYIAERDCDCDFSDGSPTDDRTSCDTCQAAMARASISRALDPRLESAQPNRMRNAAERVWVEEFRRECARHYNNDPLFGLRAMLATDAELAAANKRGLAGSARLSNDITARDAQVATSVIQWLGTACGAGFVRSCSAKVENALKKNSSRSYNFDMIGRVETEFELAKSIAQNFISSDKYPGVVDNLANTICRNFKPRESAVGELLDAVPKKPESTRFGTAGVNRGDK